MANRTRTNGRDKDIAHIRDDIDSLKHNVVALSRSLKAGAREEASHRLERLKDRSTDTVGRIENNIRERPGQSIFLAFLGGLLTSAVLRPR